MSNFIEIKPGLWYEVTTGLPWSSKYKKSEGKGLIKTYYDGEKKLLTAKDSIGYYIVGGRKKWHRVVWSHFNGSIPKGMEVDHKNNNRVDNRIENLQLLSHKDNTRFRSIQSNNTSGYAGVIWHKASKKWRARISVDKERICLGYFNTPEEAYSAFINAKKKYHGEESIRALQGATNV